MKMQVEYSDLTTNYQSDLYFALICTGLQFSTQPPAADLLYIDRIDIIEWKERKATEKKEGAITCVRHLSYHSSINFIGCCCNLALQKEKVKP